MRKEKRGQIKLSFGMIFSIILIIIFLGFGFYAIKTFLKIQHIAQTGQIISDLKSDVDDVWKSTESSQEEEYNLPSKIDYVCFFDFSVPARGKNADLYTELKKFYYGEDNFAFYPPLGSSSSDSAEIEHINLKEITKKENPFCIEKTEGRVKLTLIKKIDEALVTITR